MAKEKLATEVKLVVKKNGNDTGVHIRVQKIINGFVIRSASGPVHCASIEEVAETIKRGLLTANWDNPA